MLDLLGTMPPLLLATKKPVANVGLGTVQYVLYWPVTKQAASQKVLGTLDSFGQAKG